MGNPTAFDGGMVWVHWKPQAVAETTIAELAANVRKNTPQATGVMVKVLDGTAFEGETTPTVVSDLAVKCIADIEEWGHEFYRQNLDLHVWAVVRGRNWSSEVKMLAAVANADDVWSLTLDVEEGRYYWGDTTGSATANTAHSLASALRDETDTHLSLCMDFRKYHPDTLAAPSWLPYVDSVQPMCYWGDFGGGRFGPDNKSEGVAAIINTTRRYLKLHGAPDMPVVAMLQTSPYAGASDSQPHNVTASSAYDAVEFAANAKANGISLFRYGGSGSRDAMCAALNDAAQQNGFGR